MRFQINSIFKNFHSGERIKKFAHLCARFTRYMWMEAASGKKFVDSKISGYVWTGPKL